MLKARISDADDWPFSWDFNPQDLIQKLLYKQGLIGSLVEKKKKKKKGIQDQNPWDHTYPNKA